MVELSLQKEQFPTDDNITTSGLRFSDQSALQEKKAKLMNDNTCTLPINGIYFGVSLTIDAPT